MEAGIIDHKEFENRFPLDTFEVENSISANQLPTRPWLFDMGRVYVFWWIGTEESIYLAIYKPPWDRNTFDKV